jgi:hypothetical protein
MVISHTEVGWPTGSAYRDGLNHRTRRFRDGVAASQHFPRVTPHDAFLAEASSFITHDCPHRVAFGSFVGSARLNDLVTDGKARATGRLARLSSEPSPAGREPFTGSDSLLSLHGSDSLRSPKLIASLFPAETKPNIDRVPVSSNADRDPVSFQESLLLGLTGRDPRESRCG